MTWFILALHMHINSVLSHENGFQPLRHNKEANHSVVFSVTIIVLCWMRTRVCWILLK